MAPRSARHASHVAYTFPSFGSEISALVHTRTDVARVTSQSTLYVSCSRTALLSFAVNSTVATSGVTAHFTNSAVVSSSTVSICER